MKKILVGISLLLMVFTANTISVKAANVANEESSPPDIIEFNNLFIPEEAIVEHVVVFGGSVTIAGKVTDEVVVINGNLNLLPTAQLEKRAFVLGGHLNEETGAAVKKGIINFEAGSSNTNSILLAFFLTIFWGLIQLTITFALLIILPVLSWLFRPWCQQVELECHSRCGKAVALGLLAGLAFLLMECLLVVSVVGMPFVFLIGLGFLLIAIFGTSSICMSIGRKIAVMMGGVEKPMWLQTSYGAIVIALVVNLPFVGPLMFFFLLLLGVGLVSLALFQKPDTHI